MLGPEVGGGHRPLQIVASPPPNLAVLSIHCGQLILRKISKFHADRCQILTLKCTTFDFRISATAPPQTPLGELTALPRPLAVFKGANF